MKLLFSEHQIDYSSYTFSYGVYCIRETTDKLSGIYGQGFLPYTGNLAINKEIFYLARSVRIDLEKFTDTSENRRVDRLAGPLNIQIDFTEKSDFLWDNPDFLSFCTNYAADRFSGGRMDEERLTYIFKRENLTHILTFQSRNKIYGYVFAAISDDMLHYWYSFFDIAYLRSHSLGKWMMWKTIHWAKENNLKHVYLGTCYKTKALYKIRDHKGCEFFDGVQWNDNMNLLKYLCKSDEQEKSLSYDMLKSPDDKIKMIFKDLFN